MTSRRLLLLDEIRGFTLINMVLFHFVWDLVFIARFSFSWYQDRGFFVWQQGICWTFIFLSGFCWSLGRHQLKRGFLIFIMGALITAFTALFLPENIVIFGILTFIGSAMILMLPLHKLFQRIESPIFLGFMLFVSFLFFCLCYPIPDGGVTNLPALLQGVSMNKARFLLPRFLYQNAVTTYLGFPHPGFLSMDYFPLIPWFFLYNCGYFSYRLCNSLSLIGKSVFDGFHCSPLSFMGRHALVIYMLHQPILYAMTLLIMKF